MVTRPRIVFAGTPEFACPALAALIEYNTPVAVLTQPDRPSGRGRRLATSPVKQLATQAGVEIMQPVSLKAPDVVHELAMLQPDLLVTAAYGLLLPKPVLDLPSLGCWNLHASLLPRWRGASPIQQAILAGDTRTGITLMQMDTGLDTGDMLAWTETGIGLEETAGELHDRLANMAADLLIGTLKRQSAATLPEPVTQDDSSATHAPLIRKSDAAIDWTLDAAAIVRKVRAYNPWPVAFGEVERVQLRIFRARACAADTGDCRPGALITEAGFPDSILVGCGQGAMEILELQAPGRKRVSAAQWLNSHPDWRG